MNTWIDLAGWTLLHFVWQGAIIAFVTAAAMRLLRGSPPQARYGVASVALVAMLLAPAVTAVSLSTGATALTAAATQFSIPLTTSPIAPGERATASAAGSAAPRVSVDAVLPALVSLWLCGVSMLLLRLVGGCWCVRRLHRSALEEPMSRCQMVADTIARRLGLVRPVFVVDSRRVATPTVVGWLRPVVLLPVAAIANLTPAQVEAVLAHELAHVRRHDFAMNVLQMVAETLLFYHPAVWWLSSRLRVEREHCCDDVAVEVCGDAVAYASALTELAAWHIARMPLAVAATGGSLMARVRRVLNAPGDPLPRSSSGLLVCGLALALLVVLGSARAISVAQTDASAVETDDGRFGPPDVNRLLGFELFPGPAQWAIDDPHDARAWQVTLESPDGAVPMIGFTGRSLIRLSYGLVNVPIVAAPGWLDAESFDVTALADSTGNVEEMQAALRRFLEERLGLSTHVDTREFPVYALVRANPNGPLGPNLAPSSSNCTRRDVQLRALASTFCGIEHGLTGMHAVKVTMAEFAAAVGARSPMAPDRPIVDRTELDGYYDFTVRFGLLPIAAIGSGHPTFAKLIEPLGFRSFFTALPEQLGLRLVASTAPFEVLVIDDIKRP